MTRPRLSPELLRLVERAVDRCPPDVASAVLSQAARAVVVSEVGGRSVDVEVPDGEAPVPAVDGPLRPIPAVVGPDGPTGELLVWVRDGRFIGLERPWWTDEAPTEWPLPSDVRFE